MAIAFGGDDEIDDISAASGKAYKRSLMVEQRATDRSSAAGRRRHSGGSVAAVRGNLEIPKTPSPVL
jgi:hypothetical protein